MASDVKANDAQTASDPASATGSRASPTPPSGPSGLRNVGSGLLRQRELSVVVVVIALIIYFSVTKPAFHTSNNIGNIANYTSAAALIAIAEVFLLVCGEIDLSAGMTFALTPIVMVSLNGHGVPLILSLLIALVIAAAVGVFNGVVTVLLKLPSFITTLGTLYLVHAVTLKVSHSYPKPAPSSGFFYHVLGGWKWSEIIWAVALALVLHVVLTNSRFGVATIATGGNFLGASEAGIRVRLVKIRAFVITAVFAGFAGVLDGIHISQNFTPNAGGNDLMFLAVASAVIGGTALLGGSGTVIGAFFGALLLGVLQNGFNVAGLSSTDYILFEGIAIIAAMILNTQLGRLRGGAKKA
ncbi:MAG: ABC transporter permease [Actinomycetota bacterium]|nr:ABC transporter permease [Actinomycetota bacterium]